MTTVERLIAQAFSGNEPLKGVTERDLNWMLEGGRVPPALIGTVRAALAHMRRRTHREAARARQALSRPTRHMPGVHMKQHRQRVKALLGEFYDQDD